MIVNTGKKKSNMVKRSDLCIKTCLVSQTEGWVSLGGVRKHPKGLKLILNKTVSIKIYYETTKNQDLYYVNLFTKLFIYLFLLKN